MPQRRTDATPRAPPHGTDGPMLFDEPKCPLADPDRYRPAIEVGNAARWLLAPDGQAQEWALQTPALLDRLPGIHAGLDAIRHKESSSLTLEGQYQRVDGFPASQQVWQLRADSVLAQLQHYSQDIARLRTATPALELHPLLEAFHQFWGRLTQPWTVGTMHLDRAFQQLIWTWERLQYLQQLFKGTTPHIGGITKNALTSWKNQARNREERARRYFSQRFRAHPVLDTVRIELGYQPPSWSAQQGQELVRRHKAFFAGGNEEPFQGLVGHAAWLQADPDKGLHLALILFFAPDSVNHPPELIEALSQRWAAVAETEGPVCWAVPPGEPAYATGRLQPAGEPAHRQRLQHLIDYAAGFRHYFAARPEGSQIQTERYTPEPKATKRAGTQQRR